jgi:formate dehydrogenase assembly factor FdhD
VPPPAVDITRNFYTTSSCGVCGKASIDAVRLVSRYSTADQTVNIAASTLTAMPDRLRSGPEGLREHRGIARCGGVQSGRHHFWWCGRTSAATTPSTGDRLGA